MSLKKFFLLLFFYSLVNIQASERVYKSFTLMGCDFSITLVDENKTIGNENIIRAINEMKRIEDLISSWNPNSQTSLINKNAGVKPVVVDEELFQLIERSLKISRLSNGYFDITFSGIKPVWNFNEKQVVFPDSNQVRKSVEFISYKNIELNPKEKTVFLKKTGMKISFGAIGKGYAADKAKELLVKRKVKSGVINASGDITTWGKGLDNKPWKVAIKNPFDKEKSFAELEIENQAIVTSGNYEKYFDWKGKKYSHIINPKTGYPVTGITSVTVIAPTGEIADALATTIFVMGVQKGLNLINRLKNIECIIIDEEGKVLSSKNIDKQKW